jgi:hypothetical protein
MTDHPPGYERPIPPVPPLTAVEATTTRHTIVIEFPDRPTSHRPDAVQRAVTKAIENVSNLYDPSVVRRQGGRVPPPLDPRTTYGAAKRGPVLAPNGTQATSYPSGP